MQTRLTTRPIQEVIAAIQALDLESVKVRLMHAELGEGWSREYADRIEVAYKHYLTMLVKYPDDADDILLSEDVDEFWHTYILQTRKYTQDCHKVFGNYLHHEPHVGEITAADLEKRTAQAEKTRRLYELEFGGTRASEMAWAGRAIQMQKAGYSTASMDTEKAAYSTASLRAAYSTAAIQSQKAAYSTAAVRAERAAYSTASIQQNNAAYSTATIRAGNAAYSTATLRAENAAYSTASIQQNNAAYSTATIRAGNAAYSTATVRAENAAYSTASISKESAAYSTATIQADKAAYSTAAVRV
jgi:hypothetical protein